MNGVIAFCLRKINQALDRFCGSFCSAVIRSPPSLLFGVNLGHVCSLE